MVDEIGSYVLAVNEEIIDVDVDVVNDISDLHSYKMMKMLMMMYSIAK